MITFEKVKVYARFHRDGDAYSRLAKPKEQAFENNEWGLLDSLIQDFLIVKNGRASDQFIENLNKQSKSVCDSIETIELIKSLANR